MVFVFQQFSEVILVSEGTLSVSTSRQEGGGWGLKEGQGLGRGRGGDVKAEAVRGLFPAPLQPCTRPVAWTAPRGLDEMQSQGGMGEWQAAAPRWRGRGLMSNQWVPASSANFCLRRVCYSNLQRKRD